jgi:hypothetical protein
LIYLGAVSRFPLYLFYPVSSSAERSLLLTGIKKDAAAIGANLTLMTNLKPELILTIDGIGAASGLYCRDNLLHIISDSGTSLYRCELAGGSLQKIPLTVSGIAENIPKKLKPDFEAIAPDGDLLYIFGSGSTENRNKMVVFDMLSEKVISENDISGLYRQMRTIANIGIDDLNIEGVVCRGSQWYFFQRGNGPARQNGIFIVSGKPDNTGQVTAYISFPLPAINRSPATFTDAVLAGNTIYFLATAENSNSVYEDGEVVGSMIGAIDIDSMRILFTKKITDTQKFEGIAVLEETHAGISFLLCEDNDTEVLESGIYRLLIEKQ